MRRREFVALVSGAAAWPLLARAQQVPRIGIMIALPEQDPESQKWLTAFRKGLERLGWSEGRNVQIDYRFAPAGVHALELAQELLALQPAVVLAFSTPVTAAFKRATDTIPIVFLGIADAVGQGFAPSLAHPHGNMTGLTMYDASVSGKWLAMLKEIAPQLSRAAFLLNPKTAPYYEFYLRGAKAAATSLGMEPVLTPIENDSADIARVLEAVAHTEAKTGLMVPGDSTTNAHHALIVSLAAQYRLPAVYTNKFFVTAGGLMSYGVDWVNEFRQAALYVDRILRGAAPTDLPVQAATKFETTLNVRTAKSLGLTVPAGLLLAADEVIE